MSEHPFQALIELVNFDQELQQQVLSIDTLQNQINETKKEIEEVNNSLEQAKQKVHDMRKQVDEKELEMKELDEQERERKKKLNNTSDYKPYQALKSEIETLQQAQLSGEEELLSLWNKLETNQKVQAQQQEIYTTKTKELIAQIEQKQQEIEKQQSHIDEQIKTRPEKVQRVPEEWLEKYEMMKARVTNPVVGIAGTGCGACFYNIPTQEILRLNRGAVLQCKGCFRLLFVQEAIDKQNKPE